MGTSGGRARWGFNELSKHAFRNALTKAVTIDQGEGGLLHTMAVKTSAFNEWFKSALADPARAKELKHDWMKLADKELALSAPQKEHLSLVPTEDAKGLQAAIGQVVDHGGTIHIERDSEQSPGLLVVHPKKTDTISPEFSVGIFHCTFDANCRNWHCGWGPAKKK